MDYYMLGLTYKKS